MLVDVTDIFYGIQKALRPEFGFVLFSEVLSTGPDF